MRNELKATGWFAIFIGVFIIFYGAFSIAGDSTMRGYGITEMEQYYVDVAWMWKTYLYCAAMAIYLIIIGLILAVPIAIQDKIRRK